MPLPSSDEHFRRLIESGNDLLMIAAPDLGVTYVSPSVERLLGYRPDEMVGRHPADLLHPDDVPALFGVLGEALADPETVRQLTWRIRHQDGSWRVMEALTRMLAPDDPAAGFLVNARDVTERQAVEEALRQSEERYRAVVESLNEVVFHSDAQGRWTFLNRAWSDITGLSVEASVGRTFLDFAHPDDLPHCYQTYRLLLSGERESVRHDVRFRHRDGGWRQIEVFVRAVRDARGAIVGTTGTLNDVTERRAADAALRASEARFRSLVENAQDIIVVLDPATGRPTYQSPSMQRVLGYAPEELAGQNVFALVHPDDAAHAMAEVARAVAQPGATRRAEYRYRHRDGSWRHLETYGRTLSPTSAADGVVFNTRDVTERRRAEEALRASEEHFRRMIENGSDLLLIAHPDGPLTYASPSVQRALGWTPAEMTAFAPPDVLHPDDLAHVLGEMRAAGAAPGAVRAVDFRVRHRDGGWRRFQALARTLAPDSADAGIVCNARDVTEQHAAEEALHRSEEHFRALIENGNDLLMISAPDLSLTYVSPSAERLLGYAPAEMLGVTPADVLHPDDLPAVYAGMREIFETPGTVRRISWRIRHRNGGWRHYEAIGRTIDPHSAERGAVCNARDVTERLEAQEALRRSEEHFRRLIENGSDLLMISRADGPLTYVSPSAERLLGYHPSEILGKVPDDLTHPDDVDGVWEGLRRVAEAPGSVHPIALRLRHKDGSWRALEALARTVSPHSADEGIVANSRDVTAQRAAERALQESEAKYRSVVDAAQDMITVIDAEGVVQFQSPSAARILGFAPEEMVGRNVMEFLHPDDVPMAVERLGKVITNPGTVECVQYRSLCKDGSYRHVESTGRTVLPDSAAAGAVGIVRDITARIEAEAALRQARADAERAHAEAERANRAKSEFLSRMSHELRTPLNSILGFAQLLEGVALEPDYQTGVGYILAGGRHLLTLIDEVLDISRIEAGEHAMSLEPVRVLDAVREAVDLVRPLAAARGVHIVEAVGAHAAAYVRADRQRLTQVLLNLLSNAVKYNRPGGEVRVDAAAGDPAGRVRLRVRDEGAGLTPEQQAQLFVPFARLGAERTGVEGTGLGLALSRGLAQAMGGALFLEASGPGGSVFSVDLAAAPDPLTAAPAAASGGVPAPGAAVRPAALLYIEDNAANLRLVEAVLRSRPGWRVIPAPDGGRGLALAAEHRPDLVLLDLHLPDMHGSEVLRGLRADPRTANTPVVVVSADATPRAAEALAAQGADAFLTKPLDVRLFAQTVERLLRERPPRERPSPAGRVA